MALKNLVAEKATLTEEAIEGIVEKYVRYDTDEKDIAFTPDFANLNNKAKILVYLVALQGWSFVTDEAIATTAKPAILSEVLGIPGGTLRPTLKELKDGHLIAVKSGQYSVRSSNLASIKAAVESASSGGPVTRTKRKSSKKSSSKKKATRKNAQEGTSQSGSSRQKNSGLKQMIDDWISGGWFDSGKTTNDVKERFHEEAIIVPASSIPGYLISAVRNAKTLSRKKEDVNGKQVWVYRTKK